tara:strand:+ start:1474 stop:1911 length:438 start_codon:yes stop_codon:yes gene_type:complete
MTLQEPTVYSDALTKLYAMFDAALVEIKDTYIQYKLGNKSNYQNDLTALNNIRADIFTKQQELFRGTEILKLEINGLNDLITKLNIQNKNLTDEINRFDNSGLAAEGELKMQKTIYKELFTQNIVLIITILILSIYTIHKFQEKK